MRILLILIGFVLTLFSGDVHADGTVILITGNAPQHARDLFGSVIETSFRAPGRKVINVSASTKDPTPAKGCLSNSAPWACMKGAIAPKDKDIDQIVIGLVDTAPTGAPVIQLSGYLVVPDTDIDFAIAQERRCEPCTDNVLKSLAGELAQAQLRRLAVVRGRTKIALRTTPRGALITLDGEAQGASDTEIPTFPGSHTIRLELEGYHEETRTVAALDGKTVEVNVTMRPKDGPSVADASQRSRAPEKSVRPPQRRPSRLAPILIGSAGVAAVITGSVLISVHDPHEPDMNQRYKYYYTTRTPGIVTAIGGAAAIGVSAYLWWRQSRSGVTAVPLTHGAAVSWNTSF